TVEACGGSKGLAGSGWCLCGRRVMWWRQLVRAWKVVNWAWLRPKRLEKLLREQGFKGNLYILVFGDLKDMSFFIKEAHSKPIDISDDIIPRIVPETEFLNLVKKYGTTYFLIISLIII
ncbi:hypothetical protein ACH5RR_029022, partial [Cinchona calisaya]